MDASADSIKVGTFGKYTTSAGLFAYDLLAGVKKDERREMLTPEETLEIEPLLKEMDFSVEAITLNTERMMHG